MASTTANPTKKKKFPLPRHRSRKPSEDSVGGGRAGGGGGGSAGDGWSDRSGGSRSRSLTPRSVARQISRFGRKKRSTTTDPNKSCEEAADHSSNGSSINSSFCGGGGNSDGSADIIIGDGDVGGEGDGDGDGIRVAVVVEPLPPALPPTTEALGSGPAAKTVMTDGGVRKRVPPTPRSTTSVKPATHNFNDCSAPKADQQQPLVTPPTEPSSGDDPPPPSSSSDPPALPIARSRSLTPSDYHYHTAPKGGCNAPLTPISQHYQTNRALLDLFSTLYEKDQFSVAYAVGVKFVEVALFQIPTHSYYKSGNADSKDRTKSAADAVRVTKMLGGMVDEMQDDEDGGVEKIERLDMLAGVAQQSFEEALDIELKHGSEVRDEAGGMMSPVAKIWNSYVGGGAHNACSIPDDICSFLNFGAGCSVVDDSTGAADPEQQHVKKKPKIERVPSKLLPEPVVIPQVFIPRPDSGARPKKLATVSNEVSADSSDSNQEVVLDAGAADAKTTEVESTRVKKISSSDSENKSQTKTPRLSNKLRDVSMEDATRRRCAPNAAMGTEAKEPLVVRGEPVESHRVDAEGFDRDALQLALSLSASMHDYDNAAVEVSPSPSEHSTMAVDEWPKKKSGDSQIARLTSAYDRKYRSLRDEDEFHVRFLDTFQGRNPRSTNGCTVIAPLTCIQYFCADERNSISSTPSETNAWENGIPDELINFVIDEHAAAVLPDVRSKLNLEGDAFIIPSDVHDHLIEVGLLSTSQFVGVCGGNILDDKHLASFKNSLLLLGDERERERLKGRKVAATLFFHGHVVALHVVDGCQDGEARVELIDSLPDPETWVDPPEPRPITRVSSDSMDCVDERRDPSEDGEWERPAEHELEEHELPQNAVRVRCMGVDHFDTLVRQYACSKFSEEEREFIDDTAWDDENNYSDSAFDPRIFQAFIWAEAE